MDHLYIVLVLTLISIYTIGESRKADTRTTASIVAVIYIISCLLTNQSWTMVFLYVLIGFIVAIVWSYWVQKGIIAFHKEDSYYMPYWLPIWIAQFTLSLQLFLSYYHEKANIDFDD